MAAGDTGLHERALQFALIAAAHAAAIAWLSQVRMESAPKEDLVRMSVRTVQPVELPKPIMEPPRPIPPRPQPEMRAAPPTEPPPVMTAEPSAEPAPPEFTVPAQPPPVVATTLTAARFDAAYLQNPVPTYPLMSRRLGEAGRVLLRVRVTAQGTAEQVHIAQSSGFPRLDQAALEAVRKWRFVPARRGAEAVAAEVLVPVIFRFDQ